MASKISKIERQHSNKRYSKIIRKKGAFEGVSCGYIIDYSSKFILLQETDDFNILGFQVIPIKTIKKVRYNRYDKKYESILVAEGIDKNVQFDVKLDLTSWQSVCNELKESGFTVMAECEHLKLEYFCIGEIDKIRIKSVSIFNFSADGLLDDEPWKLKYSDITKLTFDDRYANIFSKYVESMSK